MEERNNRRQELKARFLEEIGLFCYRDTNVPYPKNNIQIRIASAIFFSYYDFFLLDKSDSFCYYKTTRVSNYELLNGSAIL